MKYLSKLSLLLVSVLVISSGVMIPSLPAISAEYSQINPTLVELLSTLPALFTMLTVLRSPSLARKIGYKLTVQIGLLVIFISGILPVFTTSFALLFLSRVTFGIGIGLFNPLLFSFSSSLYQGKALSDMIGYQSAFEGMGGIIASFLVAQLILSGWRNTFWTYLIILPIFVLFTLFVPDIHPLDEKQATSSAKVKIDKHFLGFILLLVVLITVYMSVSVKLTAHLLEVGFGNAKDASNGLALMGLGAMSAGFLFGKGMQVLGKWLLPVAFTGFSLSLFVLANTQTVWVMTAMNFTIGLSFRLFMPFLLNLANQVSDGSGERRTALLLAGFNIGSALAPISIRLLQKALQLDTVKSIYLTESALLLLIAVGAVISNLRKKANH